MQHSHFERWLTETEELDGRHRQQLLVPAALTSRSPSFVSLTHSHGRFPRSVGRTDGERGARRSVGEKATAVVLPPQGIRSTQRHTSELPHRSSAGAMGWEKPLGGHATNTGILHPHFRVSLAQRHAKRALIHAFSETLGSSLRTPGWGSMQAC